MSSVSTTPLWGQAWELVVTYATATGSEQTTIASNSWEPEALRLTFEVVQSTLPSPWWFADINIYNLNSRAIQNTLFNATWATLKAGFQTGDNLYSIIWDGPILQVLYGREDVVDQFVTLHCIANPIVMDSIVGFAAGPFSSQQQIVARMAASIGLPPISPTAGTQGNAANAAMTAKQFPRGKTCFGRVGKYLSQVADDNFMSTWRDGQQAYISELSNSNAAPEITYAPLQSPGVAPVALPAGVTSSLIGTPRQTPFGVIFEVLLDPRLKVKLPVMQVQLDRSVTIAQIPVIPNPGSSVVTPYSNNLAFFVAQVRHTGDTRGNAWQTEVTGYSTTYADNLLNGIFSATAAGG